MFWCWDFLPGLIGEKRLRGVRHRASDTDSKEGCACRGTAPNLSPLAVDAASQVKPGARGWRRGRRAKTQAATAAVGGFKPSKMTDWESGPTRFFARCHRCSLSHPSSTPRLGAWPVDLSPVLTPTVSSFCAGIWRFVFRSFHHSPHDPATPLLPSLSSLFSFFFLSSSPPHLSFLAFVRL